VGASHKYVETNIAPGAARYEIDTIVNGGRGNSVSAKKLARECIQEWEHILKAHGLRLS
jgi:hypothetical protein